MERGRDEGFSLIELTTVLLILGLVAAITVPSYLSQRDRAGGAAVQSDLRQAAVYQIARLTTTEGPVADLAGLEALGFELSPTVVIVNDGAFLDTDAAFCIEARATVGREPMWSVRSDRTESILESAPC